MKYAHIARNANIVSVLLPYFGVRFSCDSLQIFLLNVMSTNRPYGLMPCTGFPCSKQSWICLNGGPFRSQLVPTRSQYLIIYKLCNVNHNFSLEEWGKGTSYDIYMKIQGPKGKQH